MIIHDDRDVEDTAKGCMIVMLGLGLLLVVAVVGFCLFS